MWQVKLCFFHSFVGCFESSAWLKFPETTWKNRANPWHSDGVAGNAGSNFQCHVHHRRCSGQFKVGRLGWKHRVFNGELPMVVNLLLGFNIPNEHPSVPPKTPEHSGVCRSRNARAGRWTWRIRTTLRKSAKARKSWTTTDRTNDRSGGTKIPRSGTKRFVESGRWMDFFPKMKSRGNCESCWLLLSFLAQCDFFGT